MALAALSGDAQRIIFCQLCNTLDPRVAVTFSSASSELQELTQAERQQLRADYEAAAALGRKAGMRSCKELREAKELQWATVINICAAELATLGKLGSVLPALERLTISEFGAGPDGVLRLAEKLGACAFPAVVMLTIDSTRVGDAGASMLAAALGRGALPRLKVLDLRGTDIGDAGLVALAPALQQLPALTHLIFACNPFGDEGLAALVTPPPPAGAPPPPTGGLKKLKALNLNCTRTTDAGCATLAAALKNGALPALDKLAMHSIPACASAESAVFAARPGLLGSSRATT